MFRELRVVVESVKLVCWCHRINREYRLDYFSELESCFKQHRGLTRIELKELGRKVNKIVQEAVQDSDNEN